MVGHDPDHPCQIEPRTRCNFVRGFCRRRGIRLGLITNGSLLSEERVERLLGASVGSIHISMESSDASTFQAIRRAGCPRAAAVAAHHHA